MTALPGWQWAAGWAAVDWLRWEAKQADRAVRLAAEDVTKARAVVEWAPDDPGAVDTLRRAEAWHAFAKAHRFVAHGVARVEGCRSAAAARSVTAAKFEQWAPGSEDAYQSARLAERAASDLERARAYLETKRAAAAVAEAEVTLIAATPPGAPS